MPLLLQDKRSAVQQIADFVGVAADEALVNLCVQQSSLEFMAAHKEKYDEHMLKLKRNEACGLSPRAGLDGKNQAWSAVMPCRHMVTKPSGCAPSFSNSVDLQTNPDAVRSAVAGQVCTTV